ncbi:MAG: C39 family peptidase [Caldilineales bacterium]|nr:C39 family peptidase [Caldilineales bacterium]
MKRLILAAGACLLAVFLLIVAADILRYGGPDGLIRRARAEIAQRRPVEHPLLVPTPLPTPGEQRAEDGGQAHALVCSGGSETSDQTSSPATPCLPPPPTVSPTPTLSLTSSPTPTLPASPTPSISPTSTPPSISPTSTPTLPASPPPSLSPSPPPTLSLTGFRHAWQTWNNCGPATLSMQLSYFGSPLTQEDIRKVLRHHPDDKNVNLDELAAFARGQGLQAAVLFDGNADTLRQWLNAGIPVLVETWLEPEPNDGMGHYRLLTGYDDAKQEWIAYDSYVATGISRDAPYQGIRLPYAELAALWRVFNRAHLVVFSDEQAPVAASIMAEAADEQAMWEGALQTAQAEIAANPNDAFAWFNQGSALVALGRADEAAAAFDQARIIGLPWRMLWYQFGPFQAYSAVGRHEEALALADATLRTTTTVEELHYWRGRALQALGDAPAARLAYRRALELNPTYAPAAAALTELGE